MCRDSQTAAANGATLTGMLTLVILSIIFVVTPLAFMIATQAVRPRDRGASDGPSVNPDVLRRPPRSRYPLS